MPNPKIHGILVQLPLPKQIDSNRALHRIDPRKDVDGFHPENVGKVVVGDATGFRPATPYGVQQLLIRSGVETKGAHAVVVGPLEHRRPARWRRCCCRTAPAATPRSPVCHSRTRAHRAAHAPGRHPDRRDRQAGVRHRRHGQARRGGDRRRRQSRRRPDAQAGLSPRGRREVSRKRATWHRPSRRCPVGSGPMTITMLLYNTGPGARGSGLEP